MTRVAAYLRVSSREQAEEGYSLDAQERIIRAHCAQHGWPEPTIFADEGRSAFTDVTAKRPRFAAMLDAAEAGEFDLIVVHRLDRFARSLLVTLRELQRLERARVGFVSINEQMDFSTPIGRVILATLAAFAEYYSRNLSAETRKGIAEKRAQGLHVGGLPWGALRADGRLRVDPATADTLALLLTLARDQSPQAVAIELNRRGIPPPRAGSWWPETVRLIVRRGAWLAEQPAPWPELWRLAAARPPLPRFASPERRAHPLSGLLRCACGGAMQYSYAWTAGDGSRRHAVRCRQRAYRGDKTCPGGRHTSAEAYEAIADAWRLALPDEAQAWLLPGGQGAEGRERVARERQSLVLALAEGLPVEVYRQRKADLDRREAALPSSDEQMIELLGEIGVARREWDRLTDADKNAINRLLIKEVRVSGATAEVVPSDAVATLLGALGGADCGAGKR